MKRTPKIRRRTFRSHDSVPPSAPAGRRPVPLMTAGKNRPERVRAWQQRYGELKQQLQEVGFVCVGSLQTRYLSCGNVRCRCHQDPAQQHGPYHYWTRKVKGRTVTVLLKPEQVPLYQEWIQNNRQLEDLIREMRRVAAQVLNVEAERLSSERRA